MTFDHLDWDTLRVFLAVADQSSMSAAAVQLGESPPTVSRKIDELERHLGARVFLRSTRGVVLTETGARVLSYVKAIAEKTRAMRADIKPDAREVVGPITLSTGDGLGPYWIAPKLFELQHNNPKLRIRMVVGEPAPDLHSDDPVIAITFTENRDVDINSHKLGVQHYVAFASRAYLEENGTPQSLLDYHKHRCILHTAYVNQIESWAPRMAELRKMIDFAFITNSGTAMVESCSRGGGIAILPSYMATLNPKLVPLKLPHLAPVKFWMNYTETVRRLPQGQLMIEWLRVVFSQQQSPWFTDHFYDPSENASERDAQANQPPALQAK